MFTIFFARALAIRAAVMMASVDELKVALLSALHLRQKRKKRKTAKRRMWVRYIFTRRQQQGEYHNLLQEMRVSDPESHFRYLRMSKERFDCLLAEVYTGHNSIILVMCM